MAFASYIYQFWSWSRFILISDVWDHILIQNNCQIREINSLSKYSLYVGTPILYKKLFVILKYMNKKIVSQYL